jgi:transposase
MSTSPYSLDLRRKVITQVESGKSQVSVSKSFDINLSTVSRWWLRYKREGNFLAKPRPGARSKISVEELKSYISKDPNSRLEDMSKEFCISIWGIYYWLKKLGYSYKKKPSPLWKQMRKDERST